MIRVCPIPSSWNDTYSQLVEFAEARRLLLPPVPLFLGGWWFSNDIDKKKRWDDTVEWANRNGCSELVNSISDENFYHVEIMTTYQIGPNGGPLYGEWNCDKKLRPSAEDLNLLIIKLKQNWEQIAGDELAKFTAPAQFTGLKARRLIVVVIDHAVPTWGSWTSLSQDRLKRYTFTKFRKSVNDSLAPHEVDHIDFITQSM